MLGLDAWDSATILAGLAVAATGIRSLRARDDARRGLARYLAAFGGAVAIGVFATARAEIPIGWTHAARAIEAILALVAIAGIAALARAFAPGASPRVAIGAFALGALAHIPDKIAVWRFFAADAAPFAADAIALSSNSAFDAWRLALVCAALHLALHAPSGPRLARAALAAVAFLVYGFGYTMWADGDEIARFELDEGSELLAHAAILGATTIAWLAPPPESAGSVPRNAAIAGWAIALVGALLFAAAIPVRGSSALWALHAVLLAIAARPRAA